MKCLRKILLPVVIFVSLGLIFITDLRKPNLESIAVLDSPNTPRSSIRQGLLVGYGGFVSSIFWVETIFLYADAVFGGGADHVIPYMLGYTCQADTLWMQPRLNASWIIPQLHGYSEKDALLFLEDGASRFPSEYRFRLTWGVYVLQARDLDSSIARDSAAKVLAPLVVSKENIPDFVRTLTFSLMGKNGKQADAMTLLLETYTQVGEPIIKAQFKQKIILLLKQKKIPLSNEQVSDFVDGNCELLDHGSGVDRQKSQLLFVSVSQGKFDKITIGQVKDIAMQYHEYSRSKQ